MSEFCVQFFELHVLSDMQVYLDILHFFLNNGLPVELITGRHLKEIGVHLQRRENLTE